MNTYSGTDAEILKKALVRLNLLSQENDLPAPYNTASGVAGKSRVYFLFLPRGDSGLNLVAKFDVVERSKGEWASVRELRNLNRPPQAMLPIGGNQEEDGVMLFRDAAASSIYGHSEVLSNFVQQQLIHNPANCVKALTMAYDALGPFYNSEPGAARPVQQGRMLSWRDLFPNLESKPDDISSVAKSSWPNIDWDKSRIQVEIGMFKQKLPNPLFALTKRLGTLTGPIMLSRVHGDLNLTNILVTPDNTFTPAGIFIIDLANCEKDKPTATDLARLESEFWHEVYTALIDENGDQLDEESVMHSFVKIRDALEGRLGFSSQDLSRIEVGCLRLIGQHRSHASKVLGGRTAGYLLHDYFYCLYLYDLASLLFASVYNNPLKVRLAVLGAALSLQTLEHIEFGRYGETAEERLQLRHHWPLPEKLSSPSPL